MFVGSEHIRRVVEEVAQGTVTQAPDPVIRIDEVVAEIEAQQSASQLYTAFKLQRRRTREAMAGGLFHASPETLARFDGEESRLLALAEYFASRKSNAVLTFDTWSNPLSASSLAGHTDPANALPFPQSGTVILPQASAADSPPPTTERST